MESKPPLPDPTPDRRVTSVRLKRSSLDACKRVAERSGSTVNAVIETAVDYYLDGLGELDEPGTPGRVKHSPRPPKPPAPVEDDLQTDVKSAAAPPRPLPPQAAAPTTAPAKPRSVLDGLNLPTMPQGGAKWATPASVAPRS